MSGTAREITRYCVFVGAVPMTTDVPGLPPETVKPEAPPCCGMLVTVTGLVEVSYRVTVIQEFDRKSKVIGKLVVTPLPTPVVVETAVLETVEIACGANPTKAVISPKASSIFFIVPSLPEVFTAERVLLPATLPA